MWRNPYSAISMFSHVTLNSPLLLQLDTLLLSDGFSAAARSSGLLGTVTPSSEKKGAAIVNQRREKKRVAREGRRIPPWLEKKPQAKERRRPLPP